MSVAGCCLVGFTELVPYWYEMACSASVPCHIVSSARQTDTPEVGEGLEVCDEWVAQA